MRESISNKILNWSICFAVIANIVIFSTLSLVLITQMSEINKPPRKILRVAYHMPL